MLYFFCVAFYHVPISDVFGCAETIRERKSVCVATRILCTSSTGKFSNTGAFPDVFYLYSGLTGKCSPRLELQSNHRLVVNSSRKGGIHLLEASLSMNFKFRELKRKDLLTKETKTNLINRTLVTGGSL